MVPSVFAIRTGSHLFEMLFFCVCHLNILAKECGFALFPDVESKRSLFSFQGWLHIESEH